MPEFHPENYYDKDGYLKPPKRLYLAVLYLIRGYLIIIMASTLGAKTQSILEVFYPQTVFIYVHLLVGLPALIAWIILSYRIQLREVGKGGYLNFVSPLLLSGLLLDCVFHLYIAWSTHWAFHWPVALGIIVPVYVALIVIKKR